MDLEGSYITPPIVHDPSLPADDPLSTCCDRRMTDTKCHVNGTELGSKTIRHSVRDTALFPCDEKGVIRTTLTDDSHLIQVRIGMTQNDQWSFAKGQEEQGSCITHASMELKDTLVTALTESDNRYQTTATHGNVIMSAKWSEDNKPFSDRKGPSCAEMTFELPGHVLDGVTHSFWMNKNYKEVLNDNGEPDDKITFFSALPWYRKDDPAAHFFECYIRESKKSTQELDKEPDESVHASENDPEEKEG